MFNVQKWCSNLFDVHSSFVSCSFNVDLFFDQCSVDVRSMFIWCLFVIHLMFVQCSFDVCSMFVCCSFDVRLLFIQCSFDVPLMFVWCSFNVLLMFVRCSLDVRLIFIHCSFYVPLMSVWCWFDVRPITTFCLVLFAFLAWFQLYFPSRAMHAVWLWIFRSRSERETGERRRVGNCNALLWLLFFPQVSANSNEGNYSSNAK